MGIFDFSQRKAALNWHQLEDIQQLEDLLMAEDDVARVFFKHSTRCSISTMVLNSFESEWEGDSEKLYIIDLLRFREISSALAARTGIIHQSPQTIVLRNREVLYHASHSAIDAVRIQKIIAEA